MKIAIDGSVFKKRNMTGVDYFVYRLMQAAIKSMNNDQFIIGYFASSKRYLPRFDEPNVILKPIKCISRFFYSLLFRCNIPIFFDSISGIRADIIFFPDFVHFPVSRLRKSIVLVHDTAYLDKPEYVLRRLRRYLQRFVPKAIKKASFVIANSNSTKSSLIKHYQIDEDKLTVINPAVDHLRFNPAKKKDVGRIKKKYKIAGEYLLYLGTIEPRKNISGIIRSYNFLPNHIKKKYHLVLAGGKGWLDKEINKLIQNSDPNQVIRIGYVDEEDVAILYSGAKIFLFPSYFEGWGMPVLEAMASGVPVITANNTSLKEAGGEAAVYVTAGDDQELADAMLNLLLDKKEYEKRVNLSLGRAKNFSWEKAGEILRGVFEKVAKKSK